MNSRFVFSVTVFAAWAVLFPQPSLAQNTDNASAYSNNASSADAQNEVARRVPAQAVLTQAIDTKAMHAGQQFQAKLSETVQLKNGVKLPRGTTLDGTITTDEMQSGGTSRLALRFTKADLKNGKAIPIEATIVGIAPPAAGYAWDGSDSQAGPSPWNGKSLQTDEIGAISGFDLHSTIAAQDSGVLSSAKKDNMKLAAQTQLSLAIAAQNSSATNGGA